MKYRIGDKVRIRKDSEYYGEHEYYNPANLVGEIIDIRLKGQYPYKVQWYIYADNNYRESDLEFWGHPINDLNKLLYPDYIEENGLLVPKNN